MNRNENTIDNTIDFLYKESEIHFLVNPGNKNIMVNATEMAKLFNKPVDNFLRLEGTKIFISALIKSENSKFAPSDVREQKTEKDICYGTNKATFMNRKLALKFAAWLDVDFEVWLFDTIDEILFGKNKKIATTIHEKQLKKKRLAQIVEFEKLNENSPLLEYMKLTGEIKQLDKQRQKAVQDLTSQYEMDI